jgi:diaminopimelate epimerase
MNFDYYKYQALGNDYIVIDPNKTNINLTEKNIQLICHRNYGIGSDGILYGPFFQDNSMSLRIGMRILNPDGSEAEKSGNGIRIFARYLVDQHYVTMKEFTLKTAGGTVQVELLDKRGRQIKVDMGTVTFTVISGKLIICNRPLEVTCLSIGNPHCVVLCNELSREVTCRLGAAIETHSQFPNRTNVQFLKVIDRHTIQIEIWERGAGYTLASGSSSCAAASAAYKLGLVDNAVDVHMPGGIIHVSLQKDGHVFMTGPVSSVGSGLFSEDLQEILSANQ